MSLIDFITDWTKDNPGKAVGAIIGFVLGILLFTLGIVKTLLVIVLVAIGFFIGKTRDDNISIIDQITGLFRRNRD
jgi:uncharacterized membrane protein